MAIDNMPDLTRNEKDRLLEPYIGQWVRVDGIVEFAVVHRRPSKIAFVRLRPLRGVHDS